MKVLKNLKGLKGMKALKNENALLLLALLVAIFMADSLKPLVNNMVGKLTLILAICYLAKQELMLGLLGALLYISLNNTLIEGMKEGDNHEEEESEPFKEGEEKEEEPFREGEEEEEGFKEGDNHEEESEPFREGEDGSGDTEDEVLPD